MKRKIVLSGLLCSCLCLVGCGTGTIKHIDSTERVYESSDVLSNDTNAYHVIYDVNQLPESFWQQIGDFDYTYEQIFDIRVEDKLGKQYVNRDLSQNTGYIGNVQLSDDEWYQLTLNDGGWLLHSDLESISKDVTLNFYALDSNVWLNDISFYIDDDYAEQLEIWNRNYEIVDTIDGWDLWENKDALDNTGGGMLIYNINDTDYMYLSFVIGTGDTIGVDALSKDDFKAYYTALVESFSVEKLQNGQVE